MTNLDYIHTLSAEEFAKKLNWNTGKLSVCWYGNCDTREEKMSCTQCLTKWLSEPYDAKWFN